MGYAASSPPSRRVGRAQIYRRGRRAAISLSPGRRSDKGRGDGRMCGGECRRPARAVFVVDGPPVAPSLLCSRARVRQMPTLAGSKCSAGEAASFGVAQGNLSKVAKGASAGSCLKQGLATVVPAAIRGRGSGGESLGAYAASLHSTRAVPVRSVRGA